MTLAERILHFYYDLHLSSEKLPKNTAVMNPYQEASKDFHQTMADFHHKYFDDDRPRKLILGINPGRFGAGQTGIPFTDTPSLRKHCDIETSIETRETSSEFVYRVIEACGGPDQFYADWFIGGVCPLGFLVKNKKGNWVNWNYYDDDKLYQTVKVFIIEKLREQIELCGRPRSAVVWGTGKNMKYLQKINQEAKLFEQLIPLEHPRYVMQYKRKQMDQYIRKFVAHLTAEN